MEEEIQKFADLAEELKQLIDNFIVLIADIPINKRMRDSFDDFYSHLSKLYIAIESNNPDNITKTASRTSTYGQLIGQESAKLASVEFKEQGKTILTKAVALKAAVENSTINLKPLNSSPFSNGIPGSLNLTNNEELKSIYDEHEKHDQRVKKLLNENELRIASLEQKLKNLEETAQGEIDKITLAYSNGLDEVGEKKTEIDNILGHVSGRAIAGDYAKSAAEEKFMADWLRNGSLLCMALIAGSLGYSFWETIGTAFDWQKSLFRITLTFLLSVPAAYLARESAKHREQQYQHLQTSLDLKALSPFVASLPDEEQHKIKIAIASKIFAGRDFTKVGADPYPLNTHEIIIELIKKLDISKANTKADSKQDPQ